MKQATRARILSRLAHRGQTDKAGNPYFQHPERVAANIVRRSPVRSKRRLDALLAVAYLHDVLEDTWVTEKHLRWLGLSPDVIAAVVDMTRIKGEPRDTYLKRVRKNPLAKPVKLADIEDNSNPERLALLDQVTRDRLVRKYTDSKSVILHGYRYAKGVRL